MLARTWSRSRRRHLERGHRVRIGVRRVRRARRARSSPARHVPVAAVVVVIIVADTALVRLGDHRRQVRRLRELAGRGAQLRCRRCARRARPGQRRARRRRQRPRRDRRHRPRRLRRRPRHLRRRRPGLRLQGGTCADGGPDCPAPALAPAPARPASAGPARASSCLHLLGPRVLGVELVDPLERVGLDARPLGGAFILAAATALGGIPRPAAASSPITPDSEPLAGRSRSTELDDPAAPRPRRPPPRWSPTRRRDPPRGRRSARACARPCLVDVLAEARLEEPPHVAGAATGCRAGACSRAARRRAPRRSRTAARSLATARRTSVSSSDRACGSIRDGGSTAHSITAWYVSYGDGFLNSRRPVKSSCKITPSANTSVRRSTVVATHCSGDMYANLPLIVPDCVRVVAQLGLRDAEVDDLHHALEADDEVLAARCPGARC